MISIFLVLELDCDLLSDAIKMLSWLALFFAEKIHRTSAVLTRSLSGLDAYLKFSKNKSSFRGAATNIWNKSQMICIPTSFSDLRGFRILAGCSIPQICQIRRTYLRPTLTESDQRWTPGGACSIQSTCCRSNCAAGSRRPCRSRSSRARSPAIWKPAQNGYKLIIIVYCLFQ
jgi:hypothetical protein